MKYLVIFYNDPAVSCWHDAGTLEAAERIAREEIGGYRYAKIMKESETVRVFPFHREQQMECIKTIERS